MLKLQNTLGYYLLRKNSLVRDAGDYELCLDYNFWRIELWKMGDCETCRGSLMEYCTSIPVKIYAFDFKHGFYTMKGSVMRRPRR